MSRAKSFVIHGNYFYEIVLMVHASTHLNKLELELTTSKDIMAKELTEKRFYVYIFYSKIFKELYGIQTLIDMNMAGG